MRTDSQWFALYGESHRNPINKAIHYVCVPAILYAVLGIFDALSGEPFLNLSFSMTWVVIAIGACFYLSINGKLAVVTVGTCLLLFWSLQVFQNPIWQLQVMLAVFVLAWVFQFVGHKIEGQKPSFLEDLAFLLIGPFWIIDQWTGQRLRSRPR